MSKKRADVIYTLESLHYPYDGQAWAYGGALTSIKSDGVLYKDASSFGGLDEAYHALDVWRGMGYAGAPSSPVSFYRETLRRMKREQPRRFGRTCASANKILEGYPTLWIESRTRGALTGRWYHYDLTRAFYWAGVEHGDGLPLRVRPYRAGDPWYVVRMRVTGSRRDLPNVLEATADNCVVTSEDVAYYGLRGDVLGGVSMHGRADLRPIFDRLREALPPAMFKTCQSGYWGLHAMDRGVDCVSVRGGERRVTNTLYNRLKHHAWGALITRRVMRRVHEQMEAGGALCYVDSVVTRHEITDQQAGRPGSWALEHVHDGGVWIDRAGMWTGLGEQQQQRGAWYKHSGVVAAD